MELGDSTADVLGRYHGSVPASEVHGLGDLRLDGRLPCEPLVASPFGPAVSLD